MGRKTLSFRLLSGVDLKETQYSVMLRCTKEGKIKEISFHCSHKQHNFKNDRERALFWKTKKSSCICLECGELDFRCLQEHHPDKEKMSDFKICLCANCHAKLHWNIGKRKL